MVATAIRRIKLSDLEWLLGLPYHPGQRQRGNLLLFMLQVITNCLLLYLFVQGLGIGSIAQKVTFVLEHDERIIVLGITQRPRAIVLHQQILLLLLLERSTSIHLYCFMLHFPLATLVDCFMISSSHHIVCVASVRTEEVYIVGFLRSFI